MKICQINSVFAQGSTGKIVQDIHNTLLEQGQESFVIYGDRKGNPDFLNVYPATKKFTRRLSVLINRIVGLQYGGAYFQTRTVIKLLKLIKADIVHVQNINGGFVNIYKLLFFLAKNNIKTVVTLHGEFLYTGSCGHSLDCNKWKTQCGSCPRLYQATNSYFFDRSSTAWQKMRDSFALFKKENIIITSVSEWVNRRANQSPILDGIDKYVVHNGIDTTVFSPKPYAILKQSLKLDQERILLYVTAYFETESNGHKGGRYILELAKMLKDKNIKIIIAANYGSGADLPKNIIYHGRTKTQSELAQLYSMADLSIITSKKETFSMPVAESLCCGTPIIGFEAGGPESIGLSEYSEFVTYGDTVALYNCIIRWMNEKRNNKAKYAKLSILGDSAYSKAQMTENYNKIYSKFRS